MKGFVYVVPSGYESDVDLQRWINLGVSYVASLPAKPSSGKNRPPNKQMQRARPAPAKKPRR